MFELNNGTDYSSCKWRWCNVRLLILRLQSRKFPPHPPPQECIKYFKMLNLENMDRVANIVISISFSFFVQFDSWKDKAYSKGVKFLLKRWNQSTIFTTSLTMECLFEFNLTSEVKLKSIRRSLIHTEISTVHCDWRKILTVLI